MSNGWVAAGVGLGAVALSLPPGSNLGTWSQVAFLFLCGVAMAGYGLRQTRPLEASE